MENRTPKTIKELRKETRYTLKQLAKGTGIPYGTIVGYNCGTRKMTLDAAKKIAEFFGISADDIKNEE